MLHSRSIFFCSVPSCVAGGNINFTAVCDPFARFVAFNTKPNAPDPRQDSNLKDDKYGAVKLRVSVFF